MLAHTIRHVTKMTTRFINAFLNYYFFFTSDTGVGIKDNNRL